MKKKKIEIDGILRKLREFENDPRYGDRLYAIEENIKFAEAMKSLPRYVWWLLTRAYRFDFSHCTYKTSKIDKYLLMY